MSNRSTCRNCKRCLSIESKQHVVVFYHINLGSYVGCRVTKVCRKCKIYEHYGYWTEKGCRYFDKEALGDTAFDMTLLRECSSLLLVGAMPFSTYAASYNRRFGYNKEVLPDQSKGKRMKR